MHSKAGPAVKRIFRGIFKSCVRGNNVPIVSCYIGTDKEVSKRPKGSSNTQPTCKLRHANITAGLCMESRSHPARICWTGKRGNSSTRIDACIHCCKCNMHAREAVLRPQSCDGVRISGVWGENSSIDDNGIDEEWRSRLLVRYMKSLGTIRQMHYCK